MFNKTILVQKLFTKMEPEYFCTFYRGLPIPMLKKAFTFNKTL